MYLSSLIDFPPSVGGRFGEFGWSRGLAGQEGGVGGGNRYQKDGEDNVNWGIIISAMVRYGH